MDTQRKTLGLLNITLLCLFISNIVYLLVAKDHRSFESYHHDSLVILLYVWIPINLFYLITLRSLVKINTVRFGLIPLNILSFFFFCFVTSDYAHGISGSECFVYFSLYFLITLPLHLILGLKIRHLIEKQVLRKMILTSLLSSGIISVSYTVFLYFAYFHGFIVQHIILALIFVILFFLILLIPLSLWKRIKSQ
jgi:hypothetical protein